MAQKCNKKLHKKKYHPPWAPSLFRGLRGPWIFTLWNITYEKLEKKLEDDWEEELNLDVMICPGHSFTEGKLQNFTLTIF